MPGSESHRDGRKPKSLAGKGASFVDTMSQFWQRSYAADYIGFAMLFASYLLIQFFMDPFHRLFRLDDPRIQLPHAEVERVPVSLLFVYALGVPFGVLIIWTLAFRPDLHKAHVTMLGLLISVVTTTFLTDVFKNTIGRPRPDLIDRCKPELSTPGNVYVTFEVCTETNHHILHDGWRSFPSGHSSSAFAGLGYLALFFASQTHALRPRADLARVLLCLAPLLGAALIAISRLEDYRHDVFDVVAGSALGMLVAWFNWRRYYPRLQSTVCHEPYPSVNELGEVSPGGGFRRVRDEEEGYLGDTERFEIGGEEEENRASVAGR